MLALAIGLPVSAAANGPGSKPFGGAVHIGYAERLWGAMRDAGLAGGRAIQAVPYEGQHPHGAVLQTLVDEHFTLDGHTGVLLIKRNYGGEGISRDKVANDPDAWLKSVTVMYRREAGYDPDNANWFWAKYKPDGALATNPKGMPLAGRVAKGMDQGCIACHSGAPGNDLVFNNDRYAE